jgi:hypothetical protein
MQSVALPEDVAIKSAVQMPCRSDLCCKYRSSTTNAYLLPRLSQILHAWYGSSLCPRWCEFAPTVVPEPLAPAASQLVLPPFQPPSLPAEPTMAPVQLLEVPELGPPFKELALPSFRCVPLLLVNSQKNGSAGMSPLVWQMVFQSLATPHPGRCNVLCQILRR